jgi:sec-independent protein translocase protein TatB
MLDFGWQEFLVIGVVAVLVVGPKELPRVFRTVSGLMRKARSLAGEFHSAMDEMAREADLQDIKNEVTKAKSGSSNWVKDIDPTGEVSKSMKDTKEQVSSAKDWINKSARPNFPDKTPTASTTASSSATDSPSTTTPKPDVKADGESVKDAKTANPDGAASKTGPDTAPPKAAARKATAKKAPVTKTSAAKTSATKAGTPKTAPAKTAVKKAGAKKTVATKAAAVKTGDKS